MLRAGPLASMRGPGTRPSLMASRSAISAKPFDGEKANEQKDGKRQVFILHNDSADYTSGGKRLRECEISVSTLLFTSCHPERSANACESAVKAPHKASVHIGV